METETSTKFCTLDTKKVSTLKAGGTLKKVCYPSSMAELLELSRQIKDNNEDYIIIGSMSNILVLEGGYDNIAISAKKLKGIEVYGEKINSGSGEKLSKIITIAAQNQLSGLEKLCGIPGTVGGAICMNSGCYGSEISNTIEKVYLFDMDKQEPIEKTQKELGLSYRKSEILKGNLVVIGVSLKLEEKNIYDIKNTMRSVSNIRRCAQPSLPSLGSVFKRVGNTSAAIFIEGAGLKGHKINDMQISLKHANFIINNGRGNADDYLKLIELAEEKVYERYGIRLEREVQIVGKPN